MHAAELPLRSPHLLIVQVPLVEGLEVGFVEELLALVRKHLHFVHPLLHRGVLFFLFLEDLLQVQGFLARPLLRLRLTPLLELLHLLLHLLEPELCLFLFLLFFGELEVQSLLLTEACRRGAC